MAGECCFNVVIDTGTVRIDRVEPGDEGYEQARKNVIHRERDAIELHRRHRETGESGDGVYSFVSIENAKSFALLSLKSFEQAVEDNLDRIQQYIGDATSG